MQYKAPKLSKMIKYVLRDIWWNFNNFNFKNRTAKQQDMIIDKHIKAKAI